jgi:hypothetical protein
MVDSWFKENQKWTGNRAALEAMALDYRRTPADDEVASIANNPMIKWLSKYYDKAGHLMTFAMRNGDNFAVKATVLAEYSRLLKEKIPHDNIHDIDFKVVEGKILTQATLNAEQNVNTSNKILRGKLFTDKNANTTVLRNLLFAFSSHSGNLATQVNLAIRDIVELKSLGAPKEEIESKARTIAAIATQQVAFTTARFTIGMLLAKGMIALVQSFYDDEEGKIEDLEVALAKARSTRNKEKILIAEAELQDAKTVRKIVTKFKQSTSSFDSLFKQVIRDGTGAFHLSFNNSAMQKVLFTMIPVDPISQMVVSENQKQTEDDLKAKIKKAKETGRIKEAARLSEQLTIIEAAEYIPVAFDSFGGSNLGGLYGATLDSYFRASKDITGAITGTKEWSMNDYFITAVAAGVGQSEMTKTLKLFDKIENENWKNNQALQDRLKEESETKKSPSLRMGISMPSLPR